ncbi:hypothetical protein [Nostoc sphaeroides]|uniref:Uncharacterized protein n=1 Tax=Nostoc sphaeroides CCNUC1 TaxID=2653204 RepID=A0A5P8WFP6_9NOSO|nr:hypothetical protein [Nostoc sphaeroides]QFS51655.1 hypothetical protein GXM_09149 [Nostoc sphaeroides CCNUC1]
MPQVATTVTPCVKVEELRVVEISFYDHEYYADDKLIASITYDENHLTQRWVVMVNDAEVHRAATPMLCHRYICWQYKRGTLPVQQEAPLATTGNEVMCEIPAQCEQFGFELLDDGIYKDEQKLGSIGCTEGKWWVIRATSVHQQKVPCDSAFDAVWVLSMVELTQASSKEMLDKPFEQLTADVALLRLK